MDVDDKKAKIEIKDIPVIPQVAAKVLQLQEDNLQISFNELERIIKLDPAITARILKVANSALYARQKEITNLQQAITLLGFKMIKSMILLICASNIYGKTKKKFKGYPETIATKSSVMEMWRHLVLTAFIARHMATKMKLDDRKEDIFVAGLLHDIGRVVLMINHSELYEKFLQEAGNNLEKDILRIEDSIFGYNHLEVGKLVLEKWNFPDELVDVISQHHSKHIDSPFKTSITIVSIANLYARVLVNERLSVPDLDNQEEYMKILSISEEDNEYYSEKFMEEIEKDEFYNISTHLS
ncbi:MAG: HDOD domain-containing protein [Spirochaetes bacterium]|nr:HDOD domain-containing protein [Spirochaetota bacterium]